MIPSRPVAVVPSRMMPGRCRRKLHLAIYLESKWFLNRQMSLWCFHQNRVGMMTSWNGNIFLVTGPLCGEFTGTGEFPAQRPVTWSFDVSFDLRLNRRFSKLPWGCWFETLSVVVIMTSMSWTSPRIVLIHFHTKNYLKYPANFVDHSFGTWQRSALLIKKSRDHVYGIWQYKVLNIKSYLRWKISDKNWVLYENMNKDQAQAISIDILKHDQNGRYLADDILKCVFASEVIHRRWFVWSLSVC